MYRGGLLFPFIAVATFIPFLIIPAVAGGAIVILLVNAFPARRTKDILSVVAVFTGASVVLLVRLLRPEKFARPEGLQSLVDFIALLRTPTAPYLPSEWVQRTIMSSLDGNTDWLALYLLWTTAGAAHRDGRAAAPEALHGGIHQGAGEHAALGSRAHPAAHGPLPAPSRSASCGASS